MPIVPQSDGQHVGPGPVRGGFDASVDPNAMGAAVARGLGDVGAVQQDIYLRHKQAADQIAVQEAEVRAAHLTNQLLYDPQTGALNRRGKDAANIPGETFPKLQQGLDGIAGGLKNDSQKRAFAAVSASRRTQVDTIVQQHISSEIKRWDDETTQGAIDAGRNDALVNFMDPKIVQDGIARQLTAIDEHAKRNGIPPELREAAIRDAESTTRAGVIGRMVDNGQTEEARQTYEVWKFRIDGQHQQIIDRTLKAGIQKDEARKIADDIIMTEPADGKPRDELSALQELDARKDMPADVHDRTRNLIVQHFGDQRRAEDQRQADTYDSAVQALTDPKNTKGIDGVPPSLVAGLTKPQYKEAFIRFAAQQAKREAPTTDPNLYEDLYRRASHEETRAAFLEEHLSQYRDRLAPADFQELVKMQARMQEEKVKDAGKLGYARGIESNERIVTDVLKGAGIIKPHAKDMTVDDNARVSNFRSQLSRAVAVAEENTGKIATPEVVRAEANKLMTQTTWQTPRAGLNPVGWVMGAHNNTAPAFESPGYDKIAYTINDVPAADIDEITSEYRKQGVNVEHMDPKALEKKVLEKYNTQLLIEARQAEAKPDG